MPKGFDSTKPNTGGNNTRLEELVDVFKIPKDWAQVRFLPEITSVYMFWITIKDKEGNKAKAFPKLCLDYNPDTEEFDKEICPYRKNQIGRGQKVYIANAIIRELQQNEPRKLPKHTKKERKYQRDADKRKIYRKDKESGSWTPVRVVRMPSTVVKSLQGLRGLNKHKGSTYDITDPKYGADVHLSHDPSIDGAAQYKVQLAERAKLSQEEWDYLRYTIHGILQPETVEEAKEEVRKIKPRLWKDKKDGSDSSDGDGYYDSDSDKKKSKKRKPKSKDKKKDKKSKRKSKKDDSSDLSKYEDSSDINIESSDDKKSKKKPKSSKNDRKKDSKKSKSKDKKRKSKRSKRSRSSDSSDSPFD